ncbi:hypothetical protein [Cetobacterium somerae]
MIEFIFLNGVEITFGGVAIILIGLLLRGVAGSFKLENLQIITFIIGSILSMIGAFLLLSLIMVSAVCSKEFTIMKILAQKPNLKKEELMKFDVSFLESILDELDIKREEEKQKKIQKIISS